MSFDFSCFQGLLLLPSRLTSHWVHLVFSELVKEPCAQFWHVPDPAVGA